MAAATLVGASLMTAWSLPGNAAYGQTQPEDAAPPDAPDHASLTAMRFQSLDFKEATMGNIARTLAEATGINIVVSPEAADREITVFLNDVSIEEAIELIARTNGLYYHQSKEGQLFRIMTVEEYQNSLTIVNDPTTRIFELKHPNPVTVATAISDLFGSRVELNISDDEEDELEVSGGGINGNRFGRSGSDRDRDRDSDRGRDRDRSSSTSGFGGGTDAVLPNDVINHVLTPEQFSTMVALQAEKNALAQAHSLAEQRKRIYISVVKEHNLIGVRTADGSAMQTIEALIKQLDRPMPQVLLEMEILEVRLNDDFRSLFNWSYQDGPQAAGGNPFDPGAAFSPESILGLGNFPLSSGAGVYQFLNDHLRLQVELMKSDGRVNTVGTPSVLATNNRASRLFVGREQPVRVGVNAEVESSDNSTASVLVVDVERRNIGTTLLVRPKINDDNSVTLAVVLDTSTFVPNSIVSTTSVNGVPVNVDLDAVNTNQLELTVGAKDGLTVAVGGLTQTTITDTESRVPLLSDIPLIGEAFKNRINDRQKTELVLLITPHILYTKEDAERVRKQVEDDSDHLYYQDKGESIDQYFDAVRDPENQPATPLNP